MHRRQYIPGSDVKISRAELAQINRNLVAQKEQAEIAAKNARLAQKRAEGETFRAKARRAMVGVRKFFTQPVRLPKFSTFGGL